MAYPQSLGGFNPYGGANGGIQTAAGNPNVGVKLLPMPAPGLPPPTPDAPMIGDPGRAPSSPQIVGPHVGPMTPVPGYQAPTVGAAPTSTPYGDFTAPSPTSLSSDPSYQFDLAEQLRAQQHSAAAHGTLLTGGLQKRLGQVASDVASTHYGDIFNRALAGYTANRDTNAQNFGQNLSSYNAGTGATLDAGRLGLSANQNAYGQARDAYGDLRDQAAIDAGVTNTNAAMTHQDRMDEYARQVALQRTRLGVH